MKWRFDDLTGRKFNLLTVIEIYQNNGKWIDYLCKCDCWNEKIVRAGNLRTWMTKSCWCIMKKSLTKHWLSYDPFYRKYKSITHRCYNIKQLWYRNYWWRWIKIERQSFEEFKDDMYESYLEHIKVYWIKETTIERKDTNWNYSKSNCKWATNKEQQYNRRCTLKIYWMPLKLYCEQNNIRYGLICWRIRRHNNIPIEQLIKYDKWYHI